MEAPALVTNNKSATDDAPKKSTITSSSGASGEGGGRVRWARLESPSGPVAIVADDQGTAVTHVNFFPTSDTPPPECAGLHQATPPPECAGLHQATPDQLPAHPVLAKAVRQLEEYFAGQRTTFDLPLRLPGTEFQKARPSCDLRKVRAELFEVVVCRTIVQSVWEALQRIPYGETTTYSDIAHRINRPAARRAVGAANGKNPICICVPCHRVIGSNGQLVGYSGGLPHKQWLLDMEKRNTHVLLDVKKKRRAREEAASEEKEEATGEQEDDDDEKINESREPTKKAKRKAKHRS